jgi:Ca2+-binding RTX toxin-like protein
MAGNIVIGRNDRNDVIHVPGDGTDVPSGFNEIAQATNDDDLLDGQDGDDRLIGGGGNDELIGGAGADVLDGGTGSDTASYLGSMVGVQVSLSPGQEAGGDAQGDTLVNVENVEGSAFDDVLIGSDETTNNLRGFGSNDTLKGFGGDDILQGDGGDDNLLGGAGADRLSGGDGFDTVTYSAMDVDGDGDLEGVAMTIGGTGTLGEALGDTIDDDIEKVIGTTAGDDLVGSAKDNELSGNDGNDDLTGGGGNDTLVGGAGNDDLVGGAGGDQLSGGDGIDRLRYGGEVGVQVNLATLVAKNGEAQGDVLTADIENVTGTVSGDDLVGSAADNQLDGSDGNDDLTGGGGNDILNGQSDNDDLAGGAGADQLQGGGGNDDLVGGAGGDRLFGGTGIDTISYGGTVGVQISLATLFATGGEAQDDVLGGDIENVVGSAGGDLLAGSLADNRLTGNAGDDGLFGADGNDVLVGGNNDDFLHGGAGADSLSGGSGIDTIAYGGAVGVTVDLTTLIAKDGEAQGDLLNAGHDIENILGSDGRDTLTGSAVANILGGGNENDVLSGLGGDDTLLGGDGDDVLRGGDGADQLDGGVGKEEPAPAADGIDLVTYFGAAAAVTVDLQAGTGSRGDAQGDTYFGIENVNGGTAGDIIIGNSGVNVLNGFQGDDVLRGGAGADTLDGGVGIDTASYFTGTAGVVVSLVTGKGSAGDALGDTLTGIENLNGSRGGDSLVGNTGVNALQGFDGNDVLTGAGGKDTLTGGLGADRFVYGSVTQSVVGANADRITDFSHAQVDRIDLSAIDASTLTAGDQAFRFIGSGLYTHHAGELRFAVTGGVTTIAGDVDGNGTSDFHITLTGALTLVAADFVL